MNQCQTLKGLPDARVTEMTKGLPIDYLNDLRSQVSLPPIGEGRTIAKHAPNGGMLSGTDGIIDESLGLSDVKYRTKTAALRLSQRPCNWRPDLLLTKLYRRIEANWDGSQCQSSELWRWRAMPYISPRNTSTEKMLEKAIVRATNTWVNQIPAASGLLRNYDERHKNIDLGRRLAPDEYELIELKVGVHADTPLRAAFEIVGCGLLYCFARMHAKDLNLAYAFPVLKAKSIYLKVLGPREIYLGYRLDWLCESLDTSLRKFSRDLFGGSLEIRFAFESFPAEFMWPCSDADLRAMLEKRVAHNFGS